MDKNTKTYKIENEHLPEIFKELDKALSMIEVKGDSVVHMYTARGYIKDMYTAIKEFPITDTEQDDDKESSSTKKGK